MKKHIKRCGHIKRYATILMLVVIFIQPVFGGEAEIKNIVESVATSSGYRYDAKDNMGNVMDTLKIIDGPSNNYIGVYHVLKNNTFNVKVATSTDVLNWKYEADLDSNASYPTIIRLSDGGYVVGMQINDGTKIWLRFKYYIDINDLLSGTSVKDFDANHILAPPNSGAEGTPNIYSVTMSPDIYSSTMDVGFNYGNSQARGLVTDFSSWTAQSDNQVNSAITALGASSTIDRDNIIYDGDYNLIEGQLTQGDWSSFRIFLYNFGTEKASQLSIKTHKGSTSFSNPTITKIKDPNGNPALVMTMLIRTEGSALGEPGELIYYGTIATPTPTVTTTPTNIPTTTPTATMTTTGSTGNNNAVTTTPTTTPIITTVATSPTVTTPKPTMTTPIKTVITTTVPADNKTIATTPKSDKPNMLLFILGVVVLMVALVIMKFGRKS